MFSKHIGTVSYEFYVYQFPRKKKSFFYIHSLFFKIDFFRSFCLDTNRTKKSRLVSFTKSFIKSFLREPRLRVRIFGFSKSFIKSFLREPRLRVTYLRFINAAYPQLPELKKLALIICFSEQSIRLLGSVSSCLITLELKQF